MGLDICTAGVQVIIYHVVAMKIFERNKIIPKFSVKKNRISQLKIHSLHNPDTASTTISKLLAKSPRCTIFSFHFFSFRNSTVLSLQTQTYSRRSTLVSAEDIYFGRCETKAETTSALVRLVLIISLSTIFVKLYFPAIQKVLGCSTLSYA